MASGTLDIKEMVDWMIAGGWLTSSVVLDQLSFGMEIVSTGGNDTAFTFTRFLHRFFLGRRNRVGQRSSPTRLLPYLRSRGHGPHAERFDQGNHGRGHAGTPA